MEKKEITLNENFTRISKVPKSNLSFILAAHQTSKRIYLVKFAKSTKYSVGYSTGFIFWTSIEFILNLTGIRDMPNT